MTSVWIVYHYQFEGSDVRAICSTEDKAREWLDVTDPCPIPHEHYVWDPDSAEAQSSYGQKWLRYTRQLPADAFTCVSKTEHREDEFGCCWVEEVQLDPELPAQVIDGTSAASRPQLTTGQNVPHTG